MNRHPIYDGLNPKMIEAITFSGLCLYTQSTTKNKQTLNRDSVVVDINSGSAKCIKGLSPLTHPTSTNKAEPSRFKKILKECGVDYAAGKN